MNTKEEVERFVEYAKQRFETALKLGGEDGAASEGDNCILTLIEHGQAWHAYFMMGYVRKRLDGGEWSGS